MSKVKQDKWQAAWYGDSTWSRKLMPLMWLFRIIASTRRWLQEHFSQQRVSVPVIVVGNITVGGTGKTPLLIALVKHLQHQGYQPGVISRGYGGKPPRLPFLVTAESDPADSGDEPLIIARATGCPVCIDPDRVAAARFLERQGCTLLLSDDGLQHYQLGRDLEIAVVDGQRLLGNGYCLPVGPLREPMERLREVGLVVVNGPDAERQQEMEQLIAPQPIHVMQMQPEHWARVDDDIPLALDTLAPGTEVDAIAGIGNPQRFYDTLRQVSLVPISRDFPDHHRYTADDFAFAGDRPLVMTAKDAVKCRAWARPDWYYLAVSASLDDCFWQAFDAKIAALQITPV